MDLTTYKFIHYVGFFLLFTGFGGLLLGARTAMSRDFAHKKIYMILHGTGLLFVLVSGFGQLARLGITQGLPLWVKVKIGVWLFLGLILSVIFRKPQHANICLALIVAGSSLAAWLAIFKPF
jgi:hypothetical protein